MNFTELEITKEKIQKQIVVLHIKGGVVLCKKDVVKTFANLPKKSAPESLF